MGRPSVKVNPKQGKRVKEIKKETGLTQKEFAGRIFITQQTLSKIINGKASLTNNVAEKILEEFPGICRLEYLLGLDDFKTANDIAMSAFFSGLSTQHDMQTMLVTAAGLLGYKIGCYSENDELIWRIVRRNSDISAKITRPEFYALGNEILDFIGFKFEQIIRSATNNKEQEATHGNDS